MSSKKFLLTLYPTQCTIVGSIVTKYMIRREYIRFRVNLEMIVHREEVKIHFRRSVISALLWIRNHDSHFLLERFVNIGVE